MFLFFFFFKQKTAYDMRISDWSLDVCSSDLQAGRWHRLQRSIDPVFRSMTPDRRAALMRDMPIDFAWGGAGLADLHGRCDVFVVLDVLCFTTSVDVAVARGAEVLPFPIGTYGAGVLARADGAILARSEERPVGQE